MKRRALFIGGTGTISSAITEKIAREGEWELYLRFYRLRSYPG